MDSILSLCIRVYPPSSRWASFSSMSTYHLSGCHPCRCTVTSSPLQFAKVTAFHEPFFFFFNICILQKMLILFREGLGSQQNWVEVTDMFHISLAATHAYPPSFSIYVFFIFHNWVSTDFRLWSRLQPVQSLEAPRSEVCACSVVILKFVNNFISEHVLYKVWQDNAAWPRCLKPWLTYASALFGEVLGCPLLGPTQWCLLSSGSLSLLGMSVGRGKVKHRHLKC